MDHRRGGLKLRDLLVIVGLVGTLSGLFIRATFCAREAGVRIQCQNNMRQLGLGLLGFANAKGSYPNAGTISDDPQIHGGDPTKSNIYRAVVEPDKAVTIASTLMRSWVIEVIPNLDIPDLYNFWDKYAWYADSLNDGINNTYQVSQKESYKKISNLDVASTGIGILRCPSDQTTQINEGNLSYVINGGFSQWPALPVGWSGTAHGDLSKPGEILAWAGTGGSWQENQAIGRKLGVMFLGTQTGDQPWDIKTGPSDIVDGAATTILLGENVLTGYSKGTLYSGGLPTNWACPLPNFCMFLASDDVCRASNSAMDCLGGQLQPTPQGKTGKGWSQAKAPGTQRSRGSGRSLTVEGSFPFANSGHQGGCNFGFCDGSIRFLSDTIDGKVYAEMITPAGTALPLGLQQSQTTAESL